LEKEIAKLNESKEALREELKIAQEET